MSTPCDEDHILPPSKGNCPVYRLRPGKHLEDLALQAFGVAGRTRALEDAGADLRFVLVMGVIVGDDHHVRAAGCCRAHDRPLGDIPLPGGAEHHQHAGIAVLYAHGIERQRKRIRIMGEIHDCGRAFTNQLHTAGHLGGERIMFIHRALHVGDAEP